MIYLVLGIILVGVTIIYLLTGKTKPQVKGRAKQLEKQSVMQSEKKSKSQQTHDRGSKSTTKQNFIENPELTRKAHRKGELGEFKIDFQLEQLPKDYKYISDVLFRTKRGLTQIDHIIITPVGVFVIETKNYAGKIYGKQFDKMWAQYGNGKKINFYNPIRQNYGHVEAVKELLQNSIAIHSIISFTRRCELKIDLDLRTTESPITVIYDTDLSDIFTKKVHHLTKKQIKPFLSQQEILNIYEIFSQANIEDPVSRQEHIEYVKSKQA